MTHIVYGIGYAGRRVDELRQIIEALDAYLVDCRFAPYSRNPAFRKRALAEALGERHLYLQAFGNRHYQGGPVAIVDYEAGRAALLKLDRPAVLMCVCRKAAACHRTVVLHRLQTDGFTVREWGQESSQMPLWPPGS